MEQSDLEGKIQKLETGLAVQEASMAGAQATQAGMTTTFTATQTGTWAVMATGSRTAGRDLPRHGDRQGLTVGPALPGAARPALPPHPV
ncbi:hypothetical protein AQJ43_36735 [Streptomyces avermitilis]|uniref:Uncharacterized protein n=2 Tax=Streptomyces avermitilis TaxID=33903 RepID=A0A143SZV2_STRAW|nr:hypothetical protein [Streptomyces avermitilis]KUN48318.1 hypothetical protein AQJ43_36735 [Streptomyces avermitilis]BAU77579.1 hypothetical protein SAVERM_2p136 [Streptomyces avermitilis MA-4680 = NBRC 14893]GDY70246.1 hypothetical protein SAV14893_096390 [Streptomyces avermitilis]GDY80554.1 hypothetical protein SAV31267_100390 [Streptomyces avermitilis]